MSWLMCVCWFCLIYLPCLFVKLKINVLIDVFNLPWLSYKLFKRVSCVFNRAQAGGGGTKINTITSVIYITVWSEYLINDVGLKMFVCFMVLLVFVLNASSFYYMFTHNFTIMDWTEFKTFNIYLKKDNTENIQQISHSKIYILTLQLNRRDIQLK